MTAVVVGRWKLAMLPYATQTTDMAPNEAEMRVRPLTLLAMLVLISGALAAEPGSAQQAPVDDRQEEDASFAEVLMAARAVVPDGTFIDAEFADDGTPPAIDLLFVDEAGQLVSVRVDASSTIVLRIHGGRFEDDRTSSENQHQDDAAVNAPPDGEAIGADDQVGGSPEGGRREEPDEGRDRDDGGNRDDRERDGGGRDDSRDDRGGSDGGGGSGGGSGGGGSGH